MNDRSSHRKPNQSNGVGSGDDKQVGHRSEPTRGLQDSQSSPGLPSQSLDSTSRQAISDSETAQPLDLVWRQFGDQLRRRARTRLRQYGLSGQAESMDICNDVMADLVRRQGDRESSADDLVAYIMRAIDNQVLDTFRTLARQCRDFRRTDGTPVDQQRLANHDASPSQIVLRREVLARVRSILNEQDARAIDLMLENRNWVEIGEALGQKPDTVRIRISRALERVRREIGLPLSNS